MNNCLIFLSFILVVDYTADESGFRANVRTNEPGTQRSGQMRDPANTVWQIESPPEAVLAKYAAANLDTRNNRRRLYNTNLNTNTNRNVILNSYQPVATTTTRRKDVVYITQPVIGPVLPLAPGPVLNIPRPLYPNDAMDIRTTSNYNPRYNTYERWSPLVYNEPVRSRDN